MPNFPRLLYYLATAMRRVYWSRDRLQRYQERRLRSIVKNAYDNVPFYHRKIKEAGVDPKSVRKPEDLARLPILRKADLRNQHPRSFISTAYTPRLLKPVRTSGSTGQPIRIHINKAEDDWRKAIYMRANISCGHRPRDRWAVVTAPHHFFDTTKLQRYLGVFAQDCISVFSSVPEQASLLTEIRPDILDGYSGSILLVAKEAQKRGLTAIRPRIVFGTADLIDLSSRQLIEDVFEAQYYDQFGCAELDRTAWQCPEKTEYHIDEDSVIMEFVDDSEENVSPGEKGEILYTSLFNYAQPILRYAVGDVGVPVQARCACGRKLSLMKVVEGRRDSFLTLPDSRVLSPMTFWTIMRLFKHASQINKFRVIQKKPELIEIFVKKDDKKVEEGHLKRQLLDHIGSCLHLDAESASVFDIIFVEEIPLDKSGKLRSVISLLPKAQIL